MHDRTTIPPLAWLLIGLVVLLVMALGFRFSFGDSASALMALLIGAIVWKKYRS